MYNKYMNSRSPDIKWLLNDDSDRKCKGWSKMLIYACPTRSCIKFSYLLSCSLSQPFLSLLQKHKPAWRKCSFLYCPYLILTSFSLFALQFIPLLLWQAEDSVLITRDMHLSLSLCYPLRLCLCVVLSLSEVNKGSIALITGTQPLLYFWVSVRPIIGSADVTSVLWRTHLPSRGKNETKHRAESKHPDLLHIDLETIYVYACESLSKVCQTVFY